MVINEVDFRGQIVDRHFVEAEVPILLVAVGHADVMTTIRVASCIAKPH